VFENRVLRKMFGHKREEVPRHRIKLGIEELHDFVLNVIWVTKSRIMRWTGALGACGEEVKCLGSFGWGNLIEKDHLEDEVVNGRYKRKLILTKCDLSAWSVSGKWQVGGLVWTRQWTSKFLKIWGIFLTLCGTDRFSSRAAAYSCLVNQSVSQFVSWLVGSLV